MEDFSGTFSNGTAEIILGMAWSSFGIFGGFLAHEMIDRRGI